MVRSVSCHECQLMQSGGVHARTHIPVVSTHIREACQLGRTRRSVANNGNCLSLLNHDAKQTGTLPGVGK